MRYILFTLWIVLSSVCAAASSSSSSSPDSTIIVDCATLDSHNPDVHLRYENGVLIVHSLTDKTISLRNIPSILGIVIKANGSVSVQDKLILVKGGVFDAPKCIFHKGIQVQDKSGRIEFKRGSYVFRENSNIPILQGSCSELSLLPKATMHINKGSLQVGIFKNAKGATFDATDLFLKIDDSVTNEGTFGATQLVLIHGSKEFSHKSGTLTIRGVMNGAVDRLFIGAPADVYCMHMLAQSAVQVTKNGAFRVGKYLSIQSGDLFAFAGKVASNPTLFGEKDFVTTLSPEVRKLIHDAEPGIYFAAKNRLGHHGMVRAASGSVNFQSRNEFSDLSGFTQSGVFKEDKITVVAKTAALFGKMIVDTQAIVQTQDVTLAGFREGEGDLLVKAFGTISQKATDVNKLETLALDGGHVHVGGQNNIGGREIIRADHEVVLEPSHQSTVHSQQIQGETFLDKSGSQTTAQTSISRAAKKEFTTESGSQTSAATTVNTSEGDMTVGGASHSRTAAHFQAKKQLAFQKTAQTKAKDLTTDSETVDYEEASWSIRGRRHHKTVKSQSITKDIATGTTVLESTEGDIRVASKISSRDSTLLKGVNVAVEKTGKVISGKTTSVDAKKKADVKGEMRAKDHQIKAGESVDVNGGTIDSEASLLVDTLWYFNRNYGRIKAKRGTINADRMAGTFFARQYGDIETNTLVNLSLLSHYRGHSRVNALLNAEFFCATYGTRNVNALLDLGNFNLEVPRIPTFDNGVGAFCKSLSKEVGRSVFNTVTSKMDKVGVALQLAWSLKDLDDGFSQLFSSSISVTDPWRPSHVVKTLGQANRVGALAVSSFKKAVKLSPEFSPQVEKKENNGEEVPPHTPSTPPTPPEAANASIDPMALLWDCATVLKDHTWSALKTKLLPASTSNSLYGFYGPHSLYIAGNRIQTSLFLDDRSTVIADSHSITAFTGSRTGTDITNSTRITAFGEFTVGGIQDIGTYVVDAGGNLTIDDSLQAKVGQARLTSLNGDVTHAGTLTATSDVKVEAKNGRATQREGSTLQSQKDAVVIKGADGTTIEKGATTRSEENLIFIGNKTGRTQAAGNIHGSKGVSIEGKGLELKKDISATTDNGAPIFLHNAKGGKATIEKGAYFGSSVVVEKEETPDFELPPPPEDIFKKLKKGELPKKEEEKSAQEESAAQESKSDEQPEAAISSEAQKVLIPDGYRAFQTSKGRIILVKSGKKTSTKPQQPVAEQTTPSTQPTQEEPVVEELSVQEQLPPAEPVLPTGYVQFISEDASDVQGTFNTNNLLIKSEGHLTVGKGLIGQVSERADIIAVNGMSSEKGAIITSPLTVLDITGPSDNKMTVAGPDGSMAVIKSKEGQPTLGMNIETSKLLFQTDAEPVFTHDFSSQAKTVQLEIPDIADQAPKLMMKKGELGKVFKEADSMRLVTTGHTDFTKSQHSAFKTFGLEADTYTVHEKVKLSCDEGIILYANVGDAVFKAGSKIVGGVYYDIGAPNGHVIREHKLHQEYWDTDHTKGEVKSTRLDSVTFKGGAGIPYVYEDPQTGEFFVRYMGGRVVAGKQITGTAGGFDAIGDVILKGHEGIVNNGLAVIILDYDRDRRWDRTKRTYEYDTVFYDSAIRSRGGKIILESKEGFLTQDAGSIQAADGIDNYTKGDIKFLAMIGKKGKVTDRNPHWGTGIFQKADEEWWSEIPDVTREWILQGPVRHHSSEGGVRFVGSQIYAPNSKVHIYGKEAPVFESIVLNDYYRREGWQFTTHAPSSWKDLTPNIQSSLSSLGGFADGNMMQGVGALLPNIGVSFGYSCQESYGQHVQTGFIVAGSWDGGDNKVIHLLNGFQVKILGDCHENATWNISGAKLRFSSSNSFVGFKGGLQGFSPYVGAQASTSRAWGHHYQSGGLEIGGTLTGKNSFNLDQSTVKIKTLDGELPEINVRTRQNKTTSMHFSAGVNYHILSQQATASISGGYNTTLKNAEKAGVEIEHATKNAKIGGGHLIGADVTVKSQEEGAEIGKFTKEKLPEEGTRGASVSLTFALTESDSAPDSRKLIDTIGTATINGYEIPLVTGIHLDNILNLPNQIISDVGNAAQNIGEVISRPATSYPVMEETLLPIDKFYETPYGMPDIVEEPIVELTYRERSYDPLPSYSFTRLDAPLLGKSLISPLNQTFNSVFGVSHIKPLQKLWRPNVFNREGVAYSFGYKIRGTSIYLESPAVFNNVQKARHVFSTSTSEYAGSIWNTLQDKKPIYVFNRETLPYGRDILGQYYPLSGNVAVAGAQEQWPFTLTLGHEKQHYHIDKTTGDGALGYVPDNEYLTHCKRARILEEYAEDARQMGFKDLSRLPRHLANSTEAGDLFIAPWSYFEDTFRRNIAVMGIEISEREIDSILLIVEKNMLKGISPSTAFLNNPNYKPDGIQMALLDAEKEMLCEIPTFATEVDIKNPGRVKGMAPKTHANIEPLLQKRLELSEWEAFMLNPTVQRVESVARRTVPFLILGTNVYEQYAEGEQISDAFARGIIKTGFDLGTYGVAYGGLAKIIGPCGAAAVGAVDLMINVVPEYDVEAAKRLDNVYNNNPALFDYRLPSLEWMALDALKQISPAHWCDVLTSLVMNQLDEHAPCIPAAAGQVFKFVGNGFEEYSRINHEAQKVLLYDIRNTPVHDLPTIEVKTPDAWWNEAGEQQRTADEARLQHRCLNSQGAYELY